MRPYMPRVMDTLLQEELRAFGAVLLTGPKWCGKTTTAKQLAKSVLSMHSPDNQESYLQLADIQPSLLLEGENPRLIDEWQMAPQLWDAVRHAVDERGEEGLFILTGSTSVDEGKRKHSGAGRISRLKMHTMSLFESADSTGDISLADLFHKPKGIAARAGKSVEDYAHLVIRGGWPGAIGKSGDISQRQVAGYCETIVNSDISTVDGISRDESKARAVLRAYARHTASQAPKSTILKDIVHNQDNMHINTLDAYLSALGKLFVIDDLPAWSPKLRSRASIRTTDTRHFTDPAIAAYFLQARGRDLLYDMNTFGFLFESLAVRDLRIYAQALRGNLAHYRDSNGLEADAIIHLSDGRWAAVEVKLGLKQVDEAAGHLLELRQNIDLEHMPAPSFLMVVTGSEYAYQRADGIYVVPLACLRP